jgi:hypothetical protein
MGAIHATPGQQMASCNSSEQIMNNVVRTTFAGKSPFPKSIPKEVDMSTLRITTDKPKQRVNHNCKYDKLFDQLEIGKSISCKSQDCDKVAQALRGYIKRYNKPWQVKGTMYYTKTTARIFVLDKK